MKKNNVDLIKEEVYKCSKCGLCQCVCPVYLAVKNEMFLPRGRYIVLNNYFNNNKKLSSEFIKNTDICLNCNECKNFCPSNIDAADIFTKIKYNFNYKFAILPFSFFYFFSLFFHKMKKIFVKDEIYNILIKRQKLNDIKTKEKKIIYFPGCYNKYINNSDKNAALNLIEKLGYNIIDINSFCCGLPYLSDGNLEQFSKNTQKIIASIPDTTDYIVTSCDSCYETLKKTMQNTPLISKLIRLEELLKINTFKIPVNLNTVFHKTLGRKEEYYLPNDIKQINKNGSCSLMENYFILKHKKLAKLLANTIFYKKEDIDNKIIITTCQLSKWGLIEGIKLIGSSAQVLSYAEYIEKSINEK